MQATKHVPPEGKVSFYRSDGTGRDSYIKSNNGGLLSKDRIHQLAQPRPEKNRNFSFCKGTYGRHPYSYNLANPKKFVHYVSDGSGRDFYVV